MMSDDDEEEPEVFTCQHCPCYAGTINISNYRKHCLGFAHNRRKSGFDGSITRWACKICDKTFNRSDHYQRHLKSTRHLKIENEEPLRIYKCPVCKMEFSRLDSYGAHLYGVPRSQGEEAFTKLKHCAGCPLRTLLNETEWSYESDTSWRIALKKYAPVEGMEFYEKYQELQKNFFTCSVCPNYKGTSDISNFLKHLKCKKHTANKKIHLNPKNGIRSTFSDVLGELTNNQQKQDTL